MAKWNWKIATLGVVTSMSVATIGFSGPVKSAVASIDAQPYLQIHLAASATGTGTSATKAARLLNALSFDVNEQSTTGASIAASPNNVNEQIAVKVGETTLATIIRVGAKVYLNVDISGLAKVPGVKATASQLGSAQLLFGGRWFEFPSSLILKSLPKTGVTSVAQLANTKLIDRKLTSALTTLLDHTQFVSSANGVYSKSGTLASVWDTIRPLLQRAGIKISLPKTQPIGTYSATLTTAGTTATGASVALSVHSATSGQLGLKFTATFEHAALNVSAPTGATVVTPAMLSALTGLASGTGTTTLG